MADLEFSAELRDDEIIKSLRNIEKNIDRIANRGDKGFQKLGDSARLSGVKIGAVSGVVQELTRRFIDLGTEAVRVFEKIIASSVDTAKEFETTEAVFAGIFQGNEKIAAAVFDRIRAKSRELGVDLTELGQAFLPFVESIEQFERIGTVAATLARAQPEQGAIGARIALQEALSGDLLSLRRRFELPKESIDRIKELQEELGNTEGIIVGLEEELKRLGRDLDTLGGTFGQTLGQVQEQTKDLQAALGEPIVEALKEQLEDLGQTVNENFDDFELIAVALGDVIALIVDVVGSGLNEFLADLDTDAVLELALSFSDLVIQAETLAGLVFDNLDFNSIIDSANELVDALGRALTTAIQIQGLAEAQTAKNVAEIEKREEIFGREGRGTGPFGLFDFITDDEQSEIAAAGQSAFTAAISETANALEEATQKTEENRQKTEDRRREQEKSTAAEERQADAFLANQRRLEALAEQEAAVDDALGKIGDIEQKHQDKLDDITQRGADQRIENEIKAADKRVDIATKSAQRIEDTRKKFERDVDKAARGLTQDEAALVRRQGRERIEIERDIANDRIDIERDFRRQLRDAQKDFEASAEEAEGARDAVAFLRAQRRRDRAVDDAKTERNDKLAEAQRESIERRKIIIADQAFELQELRTRNRERLNELKIRLEQELADINTAKERELAEAAEAERRKSDALDRELKRREDAEILSNQRRIDDFLAKLDEEVKAVVEAERKKLQAREEGSRKVTTTNKRAEEIEDREGARRQREQAAQRRQSEEQQRAVDRRSRSQRNRDDAFRRFRNTFSRRQFGGPVTGGQSVIVGEAGAELFTPNTSGTVLPSSRLGRLPAPINNFATSNIDNSIQATVNQSMLDPSEQNAIMRSIARAEAQRVLTNVLRR